MKRVVAFGTFDIFHPGHISFLKQAKKLGDFLLVVVARDVNVNKVKGSFPFSDEKSRRKAIKASEIADKVVLGSRTNNYFKTLRTYKIDLIVLGYDQKPSIKQVKKDLKHHKLSQIQILRLKAFKPKKYKSSLLKFDKASAKELQDKR